MSNYCKHCGFKLMEEAIYCSSCGENLEEKGNQKSKKVSILYSNDNVVKLILNIIIGFAYISAITSLFVLIYLSFSSGIPLLDSEEITLYVGFLSFIFFLLVLLTAKIFNYLTLSKIILKVTYILSVMLIVYVAFKLLGSLFVFFGNVNVMRAVVGEYHLYGMDASEIKSAASGGRKIYIVLHVLVKLVLTGISALGYFLFLTSKHYKKRNTKLSDGLENLFTRRFITEYYSIVKEIGE